MGLKNCVRCGNVFVSNTDKVCPQCLEEEEEDFETVKEYIYESGQARIPKIHEETGVSVKRIKKFIREGRLVEFNVDVTIECKRCGTQIKSGDYCKSCRDQLSDGFVGRQDKEKEKKQKKKPKSQMYTRAWKKD
ncbi:hypothetical protein [Selenihalanaerobacter shriftii]|uniref:Flagellar operon protein TIGR03826 n=1 Tax=Selenihalanaerobacter shriftii TaxID=142842 RepID=A0A1T4KPK1_9FIRM|nr:hypothetical protein [Selenihalanaerobacter shriftii]SJZ44350.1 flagellar operon protein TIGR03826 [Selenihalanaerobacter shriftii]